MPRSHLRAGPASLSRARPRGRRCRDRKSARGRAGGVLCFDGANWVINAGEAIRTDRPVQPTVIFKDAAAIAGWFGSSDPAWWGQFATIAVPAGCGFVGAYELIATAPVRPGAPSPPAVPNVQGVPGALLPEGKIGVDIGGGRFLGGENYNVTPDNFLSVNVAETMEGGQVRVGADIVGSGEDVLSTFASESIPKIRITNLPYDAINPELLAQSARTLAPGGTLNLSTGIWAYTKNPGLVDSWVAVLEENGVTVTSVNLEGGVNIQGVKR